MLRVVVGDLLPTGDDVSRASYMYIHICQYIVTIHTHTLYIL